DVFGVDRVRQLERALEHARDALEATALAGQLALTLDGEHAVDHLDVDLLLRNAREIGFEADLIGVFGDVEGRIPHSFAAEETVHFIAQTGDVVERSPTYQHG